jgi:cytochrome P450
MSDEFLADQAKLLEGTIGEVHPEFTGYVERLVADRRGMDDPPDDVITRLIRADIEGEQLSDAAVRTQMMMLIIAGNETTRNLLGNLLHTLASCPDLYQQLRRDPSLAPSVIEESLRRDSPVQLLFRTCSEATQLGGTELAADDRVMLCVGSANRDERWFDEPDEFRADRSNLRDHVAFGAGPHVCPGATLARMEARVALEVLLDSVSAIRPSVDHDPSFNEVFWARGLRSLWVELEFVTDRD